MLLNTRRKRSAALSSIIRFPIVSQLGDFDPRYRASTIFVFLVDALGKWQKSF